jgi:dTDP-4-dehydrorhamnose 3,5-epimerase-like enzyme
MADSILFKKIHEDARGSISMLTFRDKNFEIFETRKGASRGGHYHKTDATMMVFYGRLLYQEVDPKEPASERKLVLSRGDAIKIKSGIAHMVVALEDSVAVEFRDGDYEVTNYAPYRSIVEATLKSLQRD